VVSSITILLRTLNGVEGVTEAISMRGTFRGTAEAGAPVDKIVSAAVIDNRPALIRADVECAGLKVFIS
jgi:hypothetical protein